MSKFIKELKFINRIKEKEYLNRYLSNLPNSILFLYGPKSCGKSTLIKRIVQDLNQKKYAVNFIDLRGVSISNFKSFVDVFFQKNIKQKTKEILAGITLNIGFFKIGINDEEMLKKNYFKIMEDQIRSARKKGIYPVIIIDEIQGLKSIYLNGGKVLLDELFNLFIRLTKVENLAHVILATSDSYFIDEIYNNAKLAQTSEIHLINHLSEDDVVKWLSVRDYNFSLEDIKLIYYYFGGSPWEIQQIILEFSSPQVNLEDLIKRRIKDLEGRVFNFYEDFLNQEEKKIFIKICKYIHKNGFYKRTRDDKLSDLIKKAIEKDFWFYHVAERKIFANARSLEFAFSVLW